jgi:hypothetical protein
MREGCPCRRRLDKGVRCAPESPPLEARGGGFGAPLILAAICPTTTAAAENLPSSTKPSTLCANCWVVGWCLPGPARACECRARSALALLITVMPGCSSRLAAIRKSRGLSSPFTPRMTDTTPGSKRKPTKFVNAARSSGSSTRFQHCRTTRRMGERHVWRSLVSGR